MERFGDVFGRESRLAVILHRDGWGKTPWTGVEEQHIKARAFNNSYSTFMLVRLDSSELPKWVPPNQLYASTASESYAEIAAVIRARAREQGAVVRKPSAVEIAIQRSKESDRARQLADLERSQGAAAEIGAEACRLFAELERLASEIRAAAPSYPLRTGRSQPGWGIQQTGITGGGIGTSVTLRNVGYSEDIPQGLVLCVDFWDSEIQLPEWVEAVG
jgi:hypothetical protein